MRFSLVKGAMPFNVLVDRRAPLIVQGAVWDALVKSGMTPHCKNPVEVDIVAQARFERHVPEYAKLVAWDDLEEATRAEYRAGVV